MVLVLVAFALEATNVLVAGVERLLTRLEPMIGAGERDRSKPAGRPFDINEYHAANVEVNGAIRQTVGWRARSR
jgi:hypothetical protein